MTVKELWQGNVAIPSIDSGGVVNLTLKDATTNYDLLIFYRGNITSIIRTPAVGTGQGISFSDTTDYQYELMHFFGMTIKPTTTTNIEIRNNCYAGINPGGGIAAIRNYTGLNLTKVVGIVF